ncbi:uncharacterized protein LOC114120550 [Aphis gossypii]|uniref:uncharacterized protein LOC114120550 n=1 Tax=Aphis gossypii TaxID=80765 RepID=UPI00100E92BA|nr:uncharacterized protein LOC114120550 [Aphis gossypii]
MFSGPLWVVLATLVVYSQATRTVENKKKELFNYVIDFDNATYNNDNSLKTVAAARPNSITNNTTAGLEQMIKLQVSQTHTKEKGMILSYINTIVSKVVKKITDFLSLYLSTDCESLDPKNRADNEVCLCRNSTVLYYINRTVCFIIKVNVTDISRGKL